MTSDAYPPDDDLLSALIDAAAVFTDLDDEDALRRAELIAETTGLPMPDALPEIMAAVRTRAADQNAMRALRSHLTKETDQA